MYTDDELKSFHQRSWRNEREVKASTRCGCFYCFGFFSPDMIDEWWDKGEDDGRDPLPLTAVCPYCGIDSVLPESPDYVLDTKFIEAMGLWAFNGYARGDWPYLRRLQMRSLGKKARKKHRAMVFTHRRRKNMESESQRENEA